MQKVLTIAEIKAQYPDQWVLLAVADDYNSKKQLEQGVVLLHGKDYLELCYKGSEIAKNQLTTILFTGEKNKNRKWLKSIRLQETPKTI